jgi:alpha-galactosidase
MYLTKPRKFLTGVGAVCLTVALAVTLPGAQTSGISGTWLNVRSSPFSGEMVTVYELQAVDGKLGGVVRLPFWFGDAQIVDGEVQGNQFGFTVEVYNRGKIERYAVKGALAGDELTIEPAAGGPPLQGGVQPGTFFSRAVTARRGTAPRRAPPLDYRTLRMIELPPRRPVADNGLARTPPMGWNSWNRFKTKINDQLVRETADDMVASGMRDAGYTYIVIDDGWEGSRDANGVLQPNANFPNMKALADYVHSKGLKLGIYSSPGPRTCQGFEGSYGHEEIDAKTWAAWGIDYLKYDWCSAYEVWRDDQMPQVYQRMGEALAKAGRPIVYAVCQYGLFNVQEWASGVGGNLWRTTFDINDTWQRVESIGFSQSELATYAGPGHWNDPDMLEVGNGGMTDAEYRAHFSLWALLAAPLLAGNDVRAMTPATRAILLNKEVIAVDQDRLGRAGARVGPAGSTEVWLRPLEGNAYAIGLFNRSATEAEVTVRWVDLKLRGPLKVRDLWAHADRGTFADGFSARVAPHGVVMIRLSR